MADGHFPDVELLRRELAVLVLEWAGKAVKDDPDGPMSTALTRAVGEAARIAVSDQHQILAADAADRIAEALERRGKSAGLVAGPASPWLLALVAIAAAALLAIAFLLGLQVGRKEGVLPTASPPAAAAATAAAPIAPLAPAADQAARSASTPRTAAPQPAARPQPTERAPATPAPRPPSRELGRPATSDAATPRSTQPVGAAPATPAAPTAATAETTP